MSKSFDCKAFAWAAAAAAAEERAIWGDDVSVLFDYPNGRPEVPVDPTETSRTGDPA